MTTLLGEDLLTPSDAGDVLSLSGDMVRLLARSGRLPTAARSVRGARMFRRCDVEQLAAERAGRLVCTHAVQFYDSSAYLGEVVSAFIGGALALDARAVVIATPLHRAAIVHALEASGHDVPALQEHERLLFLDARQTLSAFMVDGAPDPVRFRQTVGALVERHASSQSKTRLHAYAEMVDLLWKDGAPAAALELEELWNALGRELPFSLLCGHSMSGFASNGLSDPFARVCSAHTHVAPTEHYQRHNTRDARLREIATLQRHSAALAVETAARQAAERELEGALKQLRERDDALVQSGRAREQLLHRLGHELRNPLAPIVTSLELAALRKDPSAQNAVITRQVKQLVKAIDAVLAEEPRRPVTPAASAVGHRRDAQSDAQSEAQAAVAEAPRRPRQSALKVMIVDDNVDAAQSLSEVLAELGYLSKLAHDAAAALELARSFCPHVALLDIGLPGTSGIDLARQLKGQRETASMHLVALTGYSRHADREQTHAAGCEAHLVKPVDLHALEKMLQRLFTEGTPP